MGLGVGGSCEVCLLLTCGDFDRKFPIRSHMVV